MGLHMAPMGAQFDYLRQQAQEHPRERVSGRRSSAAYDAFAAAAARTPSGRALGAVWERGRGRAVHAVRSSASPRPCKAPETGDAGRSEKHARMSGEKGRRIWRSIWAVDSGARKCASRTHPLRGHSPPDEVLRGECTSRNAAAPTLFGTPISNAMRGAQRPARTTGRRRCAQTPFQTLATPLRSAIATAHRKHATPADRAVETPPETASPQRPYGRPRQRLKQRSRSAPSSGSRTIRNSALTMPT